MWRPGQKDSLTCQAEERDRGRAASADGERNGSGNDSEIEQVDPPEVEAERELIREVAGVAAHQASPADALPSASRLTFSGTAASDARVLIDSPDASHVHWRSVSVRGPITRAAPTFEKSTSTPGI